MSFDENVPNEQLRRARHLKGWTQSELAATLDTDFETVSRWERGATVPSAYFREKLCVALERTPEELGLISTNIHEHLATSTSRCVFFAAAYADAECEFTTRLKAQLQAQSVTVLSSRTLRRQGVENPKKALQAAIRTAQIILLIASPEARSSRHVQHALQIAGIYQCPICAIWIAGEHWNECVPKDSGEFFATIDVREQHGFWVFAEIVATLEEIWLSSDDTAVAASSTNEYAEQLLEPRNPYKGLKAFHCEDREDFFGRDLLIEHLVDTLRESLIADEKHVQSARLLAVVGPSGSGKSSAVMAGLLPRLQAGGLPGSQRWLYLDPMIPGVHPLETLALTFARHLPERSLKTVRDDLDDESARGLHLLANYLSTPPEMRVMLFIDQFEEVFTQTTSEEERQRFLDLLVTAVSEPQGPTMLILTLRADFYDRPMHYPELFQLIEAHHSFVLPMDLKQLREVIEKPARLPDVQLTFEGDLESDLLFEVHEQVGALPLLQFTLDQLFQQRSGHQLTYQAYREIGGVKGAVANQAETTYTALPSEEHRKLARALFLRLIDPGVTEQDTTRRRITLSELVLTNPKATVIMEEVTRAFTDARLLTADTVAGVATVEVSHEAVIREWTRLADWLDEAREDVHNQQTISEDATEWERLGKPRDRLYRGTQLKDAKAWARRNTPSAHEIVFLGTSTKRQTRSRASVAAMCLLVVLLVIPAGVLFRQTFFPPNPTIVSILADNGPGSMRQAIFAAKRGDIITFDASLRGVIKLETTLYIDKNLTIRGPGAGNLSITGDGPSNVVIVDTSASVTISDLAFNGTHQIQKSSGIISNAGSLTLTNITVSDNATLNSGGAISNYGGSNPNGGGGTLRLTHCIISGNVTQGTFGGGISNYGGTVTISNSSISGNTAAAGAGIFNEGGSLRLSNSTVSDNRIDGNGDGGGIYNVENGMLTLTNSTVSGNTAQYGGGIDNGYSDVHDLSMPEFTQGGPLSLTNSTISGNTATYGGGILANAGSQANITFSTIFDNVSLGQGGGIAIMTYDSRKPSQIELRNTLVADNRALLTGPDIGGTLTSGGYNLIQDVSGALFIPNKQHHTDVSVNAHADIGIDLALSGSMTKILGLLPGSPAIDQIPIGACHINGITTDQRGVKRPDGNENTCDIGAFESSN
jgi:transcriptional regulator with XRE-family HTH domain